MRQYLNSKYDYFNLIFIFMYLGSVSLFWGFNHDTWVDEGHFYKTIKLFESNFSLETLRTYNEIISPLTFILYAIWGKVFGTELSTLRVFSLIVAAITFLRFYHLSKKHFNDKWSFILTILLSLNPYMFGISFFCYTDMLSILFSIEIASAIFTNSKYRLIIFSILSIYTRQYNISILISAGLFYLINTDKNGQRNWLFAAYMFIPVIAFLPLVVLWKGIAPNSQMHSLLNNYEYVYQFTGLTTYIYTIFIYSLPLSIFWLINNYKFKLYEFIATISLTTLFYFYFPVTPSKCGTDAGVFTVGLFHKILSSILKNDNLVQLVLYVSLIISVVTLIELTKSIIKTHREEQLKIFYYLNIVILFLIMPISFQIWEKYILIILPFCLLLFSNQKFSKDEKINL